jgi:hypothetical protein
MAELATAVPELAGAVLARADAALALRRPAGGEDESALEAEFAALGAVARA